MSDVLDLNALAPEPAKVKFGDDVIEVKPPTTANVLKLGFLGRKLESADTLSDEELNTLIASLTDQVFKCVPALSGKDLSTAQLLKLVELISNMSLPPDAEELKRRNITVDTGKKAQ